MRMEEHDTRRGSGCLDVLGFCRGDAPEGELVASKLRVDNRLALVRIRWKSEPKAHSGENENATSFVELFMWLSAWVYRPLVSGGGTDVCSGAMDLDGWGQHGAWLAGCPAWRLWDPGNARVRRSQLRYGLDR